jgi:hypothetical protein
MFSLVYSNFFLLCSASLPATPNQMSKEPASKGGATKISEVDFDRLWRDRVNCELSNQRQWSNEYGFMLEGSAQRGQRPTAAAASTTDSSAAEATLSYASTKSTMQASYGQRKSIELKGDTHPFNRKKHPM